MYCVESAMPHGFSWKIAGMAFIYSSEILFRGRRERKRLSLGLDDQSNDQTVQTESLRENEDQNHTDEKLRLLSSGTDTSVTNNTNSNTSSKTRETDTETSTQVSETSEASVVGGINCSQKNKNVSE